MKTRWKPECLLASLGKGFCLTEQEGAVDPRSVGAELGLC